jgi:3-oxoacyl-[acyl-carrier protein] reductase
MRMDLGLKGRVAVVTGASRGIGRSIALALAAEGVQVACVATTEEGARGTASACADLGAPARAYGVDVSDHQAVKEVVDRILADFTTVDILINNAGITRDGLLMRMSEEDWDRVLDVNLKGAFNLTRCLTKTLLKRDQGRVINLASVVGISGNAGQANYAASKGGLIAMTRALAKEFGSRGVTVNAVAPGFIETDMTGALTPEQKAAMIEGVSLRRMGQGQDVAGAVVFLASRLAAYVTGQVLVVDGGMRL